MSKLKLYECDKCGKTYAEEMKSREEGICRTCMSKIDKKATHRERPKDKSNKDIEKVAVYYEEAYA